MSLRRARCWPFGVVVATGCAANAAGPSVTVPAETSRVSTAALPAPATDPASGSEHAVHGIVIAANGETTLDGHRVGIAPTDRLTRLDDLFNLLEANAPNARRPALHRSYSLQVSDEVTGTQLKGILLSASFAGWPTSTVTTESGPVRLSSFVPMPAGETQPGLQFSPDDVLVLRVRAGSVELVRVPHAEGGTETPVASVPGTSPVHVGSVPIEAIARDLPPLLERQCLGKSNCNPAMMELANGVHFGPVHAVMRCLATIAAARGSEPAQLELKREEPGLISPPTQAEGESPAPVELVGRLPPEVIQRVVRASFAGFRSCYEDGLARDPQLSGTVAIRFTIGRDGKPSDASIDPKKTSLLDRQVNDCVKRAFAKLTFPKPTTGTVTVVYPIELTPE